jgi:hypothetical protein
MSEPFAHRVDTGTNHRKKQIFYQSPAIFSLKDGKFPMGKWESSWKGMRKINLQRRNC